MLRLPPTTISLTMTEVKEFERHHRFRKYLAREYDPGELPIRAKTRDVALQRSRKSDQVDSKQSQPEGLSKSPSTTDLQGSPKLLTWPPRRPLKPNSPGESNSQAMSGSSQSAASNSSTSIVSEQPGWLTLPVTLPPPFSAEAHVVSDAHSLPSAHTDIRARTPREDMTPEPPVTPFRQLSIRDAYDDVRMGSPIGRPQAVSESQPTSSQVSSGRTRLLSSAARFVESVVRQPRRGSPTPPTRGTSLELGSPTRGYGAEHAAVDASRFRIYNDSLPASSQPQTPQNLPEARHRSRLRGAYTAPVPRVARRPTHHSSTSRGRPDSSHGPSGLDTPGFRGLYGGIENSEDSTLFLDASEDGFLDSNRGGGQDEL